MKKRYYPACISLIAAISISAANATMLISDNHIQAAVSGTVGSGNGTLDILAFTQGTNDNTAQFDDGNTGLQTVSGNGDDGFWNESYVTSAGKLKDFYRLNFVTDPEKHGQIMLALDLNETGGGLGTNYFSKIDIVLNPISIFGDPAPLTTDVQSAEQIAIQQIYTGGTLLSELEIQGSITDPENSLATIDVSENLAGVSQGGGFADFFVLTGVNVFSLLDDDTILFNVSMNVLSNGPESIFISGTFSGDDVCINNLVCPTPPVVAPPPSAPAPNILILLLTGFFGLTGIKKIKLYGRV